MQKIVYENTEASQVFVTGTFDNWSKSVEMKKESDGLFVAEVPVQGRVFFKFVVDGNWVTGSEYPTETDDKGNVNNFVDAPLPIVVPAVAVEQAEAIKDEEEKLVVVQQTEEETKVVEEEIIEKKVDVLETVKEPVADVVVAQESATTLVKEDAKVEETAETSKKAASKRFSFLTLKKKEAKPEVEEAKKNGGFWKSFKKILS